MNEKTPKKQAMSKEIKSFKANPYADRSLLPKLDWFKGPLAWGNKTVRPPKIRLTATGLSVDGFKIPIHNFAQALDSPLGYLIAFALLPRRVLGDAASNVYNFQDLKGIVYELLLTGIEDLSSAITKLKQGECNVSPAAKLPEKFKVVNSWFDHGNTVSPPAAILSVDMKATANQTLVDCVFDALNQAHNEWEKKITSGPAIAGIIGAFLGITLIAGFFIFLWARFNNKKESDEGSSLLSYRREMASRR